MLSMQAQAVSVIIGSGTSLSAAVPIGAKSLVGIGMPAAWDAANITFQVSQDGTTWLNFYDANGVEVTVVAAASEYIWLDPAVWVGVNFIKVRSGTNGTPVNQSADRTLTLGIKPIV